VQRRNQAVSERQMSIDDGLPRYPRKEDRLFPKVEDWNVEVPSTPDSRAKFMIRGYKHAADELVERALDDPSIEPVLVYPIIYCYRQFIELSLKSQLSRFSNPSNLVSSRLMKSHDLKKLLAQYLKLDKDKVSNALNELDMLYCIRCIKEIHRIDPRSFTFRYPDGQDNKSEFMSTNKIDLANVKDVMLGIWNLLEFAEGELETIFNEDN
jgi:hypothetical protein